MGHHTSLPHAAPVQHPERLDGDWIICGLCHGDFARRTSPVWPSIDLMSLITAGSHGTRHWNSVRLAPPPLFPLRAARESQGEPASRPGSNGAGM